MLYTLYYLLYHTSPRDFLGSTMATHGSAARVLGHVLRVEGSVPAAATKQRQGASLAKQLPSPELTWKLIEGPK